MTARSIAKQYGLLALLTLSAGATATACSTSDPTTKGSAGASGTGTAGASGSGTAGTGTAGTGTAGTGTAGSGTAGSGGSAGGGMGVECNKPTGLLTDFTPLDGGTATDQVNFGDYMTTLSGSTYYYPNQASTSMYKIESDVTGGNWHIHGTVGDYSGFGFALQTIVGATTLGCNKIDATGYTGISFTLSGTVAMGGMIQANVGTAGDAIADSWMNALPNATPQTTFGRCVPTLSPTAAGASQYSQQDCKDPIYVFAVPASPTTVTIHWTDLTGGKPEASPNPAEITYIAFNFPPPANPNMANAVTYAVDITIDDIKFVQ